MGDETRTVELPNDGIVTLSEANGYKAKIEGIYAGAECSVKETKNGGADSTTMDPKDGKVTINDGKVAKVTITNIFGELPVTGAAVAGVSVAALLLVLGGGFLMFSSRRQSRGRHSS